MEAARGRRRVSLDCTPPPTPLLAYHENERRTAVITKVKGPVMIPLAMISKGALRDFDVTDGNGAPLPVLTRAENSSVALSALMSELQPDATSVADLEPVLRAIVEGPADEAKQKVEQLLSGGTAAGKSVLDPRSVTIFAERLLYDLAQNFLLIALLPSDQAGRRILIKYSSHWQTIFGGGRLGFSNRLLAATGFGRAPMELEVSGASDAGSYHLEVHAPAGLRCAGLSLPSNGGRPAADQPDDTTDLVAHAVGSYLEEPNSTARLHMSVPNAGLRSVALLTALFTACVFVLEELLPGARCALLEAGDGAVAVLLAAPAVALALLARPGENALASELLAPLRWSVLGCAALLVAGAGSIVGKLHEPYISVLWATGAILASLLAAWLLVGSVVSALDDDDA